jgi:hypothetical protein
MHVKADSSLPTEEVRARLAGLEKRDGTSADTRVLALDSNRQPAKLFLRSASVTFPPAAEIHLRETDAGSSVILRLMWGPLPAPFPRAVAGLGVLLAAGVLIAGGDSTGALVAALILAGLPIAALLLQRQGERRIQSELTRTLGVGAFSSVAH